MDQEYVTYCGGRRCYTSENGEHKPKERMGVEVHGVKPRDRSGEVFKRATWRWRPIWDYVHNNHGDIATKVEAPFCSDGSGLEEHDSNVLARRLQRDIAIGDVGRYWDVLTQFSMTAPNIACPICDGSGIRTDDVGHDLGMPDLELEPDVVVALGRSRGWCDGCEGVGQTIKLRSLYNFNPDDIRDFAVFLENCGGFEIW